MVRQNPAEARWSRPSNLLIGVVVVAGLLGAISLARQRAIVPAPPPPLPAWGVGGHDAARTAHSLSYRTRLPLTRVWSRQIPSVARAPLIDGYGNAYLARPEGALLALTDQGDTLWCTALQPITDTSCTNSMPPSPMAPLTPPVAPHAMVGPDSYIYVVGAGGILWAYDRSSPKPLWDDPAAHLQPNVGVVFGRDASTIYGVTRVYDGRIPAFGVVALRWRGAPVQGWRVTPIASRGLTPVSVAPDGTLLVAARSSRPGDRAALYALDPHGAVRWHVPLAVGAPSTVAVAGSPADWVAWVVVASSPRSWVIVVDAGGHAVWRWSTGRRLEVATGGVALAHPSNASPRQTGLGYVGSEIGVYALDLARRHGWLFFNARALGPTVAPTTDVQDSVYVATTTGHIFVIKPNGRAFWQYDTGRQIAAPLAIYPNGAVLVISSDGAGMTVAETLGAGGTPLSTATALHCAADDCPTPTATPSPSGTSSPTPSGTPITPGGTAMTATVTVTIPASATPTRTLVAG